MKIKFHWQPAAVRASSHDRLAHIDYGRFKSFPIEQDEPLPMVLRYVVRNACRATLGERAEERWWCLPSRVKAHMKSAATLGLTHFADQANAPLVHGLRISSSITEQIPNTELATKTSAGITDFSPSVGGSPRFRRHHEF